MPEYFVSNNLRGRKRTAFATFAEAERYARRVRKRLGYDLLLFGPIPSSGNEMVNLARVSMDVHGRIWTDLTEPGARLV